MEPGLAAKLIGLAVFLVLAALSAAAESTLFHVNRARLRSMSEQGTRRAEAVLRAIEQPGTAFGEVTALHTTSLVGVALLASLLVLDLNAREDGLMPLGVVLLLALLVPLMMRRIAIGAPESTALLLYQPLSLIVGAVRPILLPFRLFESGLLRLLGLPRRREPHSAEEELRLLVEGGEESGVLEQDERQMIHGIFELGEVTAREIMVPRIDIVAVPETTLVGEVLDLIVATGHSRLPIYEGNIDNIVGFVYAKDVLKHLKQGGLADPARPLARQAYFVPETKKIDELLQELQQRRVHVAVVVDEYGGTAGLVTIEDLLEEIVGEIRDEYDVAEEASFERISDCEAIFDARTSIRDVNELLSLDLPDDEFDTLGGLVYDRLGKVPAENDEVRVDGCLVRVLTTEGRRIKKVRVLVGAAGPVDDGAERRESEE